MNKLKSLYPIRRFNYMFGGYNRKKRNAHISRYLIWLIVIAIPVIFAAVRFEQRLGSVALRLAASQFENDINSECSRTVAELLREYNIADGSAISAAGSENGRVNSISADFAQLNLLKTDLTSKLTDYLKSSSRTKCSVPLGALVSDNIMAGWGIGLPTGIITSGSARVEFFDSFDAAGINQTRYRLMLRVTVRAQLHTISDFTEREVITDIPIAETITVGDVPQFNLSGKYE